MHLEVLVEELSAEPVVQQLVARALPDDATYEVRVFDGKADPLGSLPERLRGYRNWAVPELRIMVLVDRDDQDCLRLKQQLEQAATKAGFATKTTARGSAFEVCNRIAVEELEAWFLGNSSGPRTDGLTIAAFPTGHRSELLSRCASARTPRGRYGAPSRPRTGRPAVRRAIRGAERQLAAAPRST